MARAKGEGTIYPTIQKNKRKKFLDKECNICKNCTNKCNREKFEKCDKCKNCNECLKYCDRYYVYKVTKAQVTVNGERKSAGTGKTSKEVREKKEQKSKELNIRHSSKNGRLTLSEAMRLNEKEKLRTKHIKDNTYNRNLDTIRMIEKYTISHTRLDTINSQMIKELMLILININTSQSDLDKVYDEIHQACNMYDKDIFDDIPRNSFISNLEPKEVIAFTVEEEKILIDYVNSNTDMLVDSKRCDIDSTTIKNIIKFDLATGMRIGEVCSIDPNTDINLEDKKVLVGKTVTKNLKRENVIQKGTKTNRKTRKKRKKDIRFVPFGVLFDEEEIEDIIKEQCEISSNENLLFCTKDGKLIDHTSFNAIFKRICRQAGIKLDLITGCNTHMMKHTAVTRMIEAGIDIYVISGIVGTSVEILKETYAHILDEFVQREIKKSIKARKETNLTLNAEAKEYAEIIPFSSLIR